MKKNPTFHKKLEKRDGSEQEGLLTAHFGAIAEVENTSGSVIRCHLRKNAEPVITGDRVWYSQEKDGTGIIMGHLPRTSLLARPDHRKMKLVAANVDKMLIVTAPPPILAEYLLDRYIVTAEHLGLEPIIILNKTDLLTEETRSSVLLRLSAYEKIGYRVIYSSALTQEGLPELENHLRNATSVFVGPSGVGKSSLISSLIPEEIIRVGETSLNGLGKHTTTMTRLYHLPLGGNLIDSPGVREFSLGQMSKEDILQGFVEFQPFLSHCKFRNCSHVNEQDCAVQHAVENGQIATKRFESFKEMMTVDKKR
jgi:ribosome biogenesis GTPase